MKVAITAPSRGIGIGLGHGRENMSLDPAEAEQRHEGGDDDGRREKDRHGDLAAGGVDDLQAARQPVFSAKSLDVQPMRSVL